MLLSGDMKLYICINKTPISGYTHIDPKPKGNVPAFTGSLDKIQEICKPAECEEILAPDMLDYISIGQLDDVLTIFNSLLRHGGKLVLGGNNLDEFSRMSFLNLLDVEVVNSELYGNQFRKAGLYSTQTIKERLINMGLEIEEVSLDTYKFIIKSKRP